MEAVSTIIKLAQQIAKAAETARRNRDRCRHLAGRALTIGNNLRDFKDAAASGDTASRRSALGRLKTALDDALKLVESRRRQSRWLAWLASGTTAARFQDVDGRITACVVDLGLVELLHAAGAQGRPPANTRAGSWKKKETDRSGKKKKDGPKNGGAGKNSNRGKKKDIGAKNVNKSGGAAASNQKQKKNGGGQQGWNGSRQVKRKPAAAPAPRRCAAHSMEDDTGSCSVM